jgi:2-succinyl-5-enolpyruvyl-6-hydroxy-3-cyclohexene-1-carboxylate synthase
VRDLQYAAPRDGVTVIANRGASGIDGNVSTAMGAALAWQADGGGPAYALVGDLTFIHDANGLIVGPEEPLPRLTIIVVNNDGGGIFAGLEPGRPEHADAFERVFGTPTGADLAALCAVSGTAYTRVGTLEELVSVATDPRVDLQVVEVRVPR